MRDRDRDQGSRPGAEHETIGNATGEGTSRLVACFRCGSFTARADHKHSARLRTFAASRRPLFRERTHFKSFPMPSKPPQRAGWVVCHRGIRCTRRCRIRSSPTGAGGRLAGATRCPPAPTTPGQKLPTTNCSQRLPSAANRAGYRPRVTASPLR